MGISRKLIVCAMAVGLASPMGAYATNGYFAHGYGTKNKGLGGAGVALPQDGMIAATNPAGMAFVGKRLDVGLAVFSPDRSYDAGTANTPPDGTNCAALPDGQCPFTIGGFGGEQSITSENTIFFVPHFAYNWVLDNNNTLGVTVYGNGGMNTEYEGGQAQHASNTNTAETTPGTFGGGTAGVNLEQLFITLSYAHKYSDKGAVGIAPIFAYQTFEAKGLAVFGGYSSDPLNLTDNGKSTSTGYGFKVGWQDQVAKGLTLAASYQSKMSMSEFDEYKGLFAEGGSFDIPATWTIGLAYDIASAGVVTFDVQQIQYSDVSSIANPLANLGTDCVAGPTGGTGDGCLGAANGAGFGWTDIMVYKLGYQWSSSEDWTWRLGFNYGDNPIPESEMLFNILAPGVMTSHITFGFTHNMGNDNELSLAAMYAPEASIKGKNAFNPSQDIELKMTQWELEASWGMKF